MNRVQQQIGPILIDSITRVDAVARVLQLVKERKQRASMVVTINAQLIQIACEDPKYASLLGAADLVVPDGISILIMARIFGGRFKERVTGVDLMWSLCEAMAQAGHSIYLMGGLPGAAEATGKKLLAAYPTLKIVGIYCPSFGFEADPTASAQLNQRISQAAPDVLFVGLGAPKQENWMYRHIESLNTGVMVGVGGSFDIHSGMKKRAPAWAIDFGLEWAYRLCMEPKRLWKRNVEGILYTAYIIVRQLLGGFKHPSVTH